MHFSHLAASAMPFAPLFLCAGLGVFALAVKRWRRRSCSPHIAAVYAEEPGRHQLLWQGTFPTRRLATEAARKSAERFDSLGDVYSENPLRYSVYRI